MKTIIYGSSEVIKHLITGPKGNGEFLFPGKSFLEGKQNSLIQMGPVKYFVVPPNSKIE